MKKLICVFLCLMLLLPSAVADTPARRLTEDEPLYTSLYERSMELAFLFDEALRSDAYLSLLTMPDEFADLLKTLRMQDFTQPISVIIMRADSPFRDEWAMLAQTALDAADLPERLAHQVQRGLYSGAGSLLTATTEGSQMLALSTTLSFSDAFIQSESMDGSCFAVMFYGGLFVFLVTFYPTDNSTVLAHAQFIPSRAADALNLPIE